MLRPPSPAPQQSSPSNIPFLTPSNNPHLSSMDLGAKFKYFVEPAFGPRSFLTNGLRTGIRMANPPSHYPHEWHAGADAYGRLYGDSFARTGAESIGRFSASYLLAKFPVSALRKHLRSCAPGPCPYLHLRGQNRRGPFHRCHFKLHRRRSRRFSWQRIPSSRSIT